MATGLPSRIIGAAERVALPELGVTALKAKVDTGARSSSLHVDDLEVVSTKTVRFRVVLDGADKRGPLVQARIARVSSVRPSSGQGERRVFIKTAIEIGDHHDEIEISLTERPELRYRMLLGRTALTGRFLVDPAHRYVLSKRPGASKKKKKKKRKKKAL